MDSLDPNEFAFSASGYRRSLFGSGGEHGGEDARQFLASDGLGKVIESAQAHGLDGVVRRRVRR
jgi:hypothetical protein